MPYETAQVPFWGDIPAGPPTDIQNPNYLGRVKVLKHQAGKGRYVLRVYGDSMYPELRHNDLILIEYREDVDWHEANGKICVCFLNREATLKRFRCEFKHGKPAKAWLEGNHSENPIIEIKLGTDDFKIIGILLKLVERNY